jgi:hypothetical protein
MRKENLSPLGLRLGMLPIVRALAPAQSTGTYGSRNLYLLETAQA